MPAGPDADVVHLRRKDNTSHSARPAAVCGCASSSPSFVGTFIVSLRPRIMGIRTETEAVDVKVKAELREVLLLS